MYFLPATKNRVARLNFVFAGYVPAMLPKKFALISFGRSPLKTTNRTRRDFPKILGPKEGSVPTVHQKSADDGDVSRLHSKVVCFVLLFGWNMAVSIS